MRRQDPLRLASKSAKVRFAEERLAVAATVDRSGPDASCFLAWGHPDNVWYRLASGTSRIRVDSAGSGGDTVVAVSRGSPDRPTEVADIDDVRGSFEAERAANAEAAIGWLLDGGTTRDGVPVAGTMRGAAKVKERSWG